MGEGGVYEGIDEHLREGGIRAIEAGEDDQGRLIGAGIGIGMRWSDELGGAAIAKFPLKRGIVKIYRIEGGAVIGERDGEAIATIHRRGYGSLWFRQEGAVEYANVDVQHERVEQGVIPVFESAYRQVIDPGIGDGTQNDTAEWID